MHLHLLVALAAIWKDNEYLKMFVIVTDFCVFFVINIQQRKGTAAYLT